jgi:hypothetical protein
MQKIFIFGLPHSGTTILRTIIGHIPKIYTVLKETSPNNFYNNENYDYILFKNPILKSEYFKDDYRDIHKIFIIRNPIFSISSYVKRHKKQKNKEDFIENAIKCHIEAAEAYLYYQNKNINKLYLIRYEDMFIDNFILLKEILSKIGLDFDDNIFDNQKYKNISHENQSYEQVPNQCPGDNKHKELRLYQVNQPFKNMNDINKIFLNDYQINKIISNESIKKLYPDAVEIIKKYKKIKFN